MRVLVFFSLFAFPLMAQTPKGEAHTVCIYEADYEAPTFSKVSIAKFLGILPDRLVLRETERGTAFSLLLEEENGARWVFITSDSSAYSLLSIPFEDADTLAYGVVGFIDEAKRLFVRRNGKTVSGVFPLGARKLIARAHHSLDPLTAEEQERFGAYNPAKFDVRTYDGRGYPYLGGTVVAGVKDGRAAYLRISVYLPKLSTKVTLTLLSYSVTE